MPRLTSHSRTPLRRSSQVRYHRPWVLPCFALFCLVFDSQRKNILFLGLSSCKATSLISVSRDSHLIEVSISRIYRCHWHAKDCRQLPLIDVYIRITYLDIELIVAKFLSQITLNDWWGQTIGSNSIVKHSGSEVSRCGNNLQGFWEMWRRRFFVANWGFVREEKKDAMERGANLFYIRGFWACLSVA